MFQSKIFVLDEFDVIHSQDKISELFQDFPSQVQVCCFSSKFSEEALEVCNEWVNNGLLIEVHNESMQEFHHYRLKHKKNSEVKFKKLRNLFFNKRFSKVNYRSKKFTCINLGCCIL